jgi:hypothetical protein
MQAAAIDTPTRTIDLAVASITADAFAPFGTLIAVADDGKPFGPDEAQLELTRGTPRFYVMRLKRRDKAFTHITRHLSVTQCLASVGGKPWQWRRRPTPTTPLASLTHKPSALSWCRVMWRCRCTGPPGTPGLCLTTRRRTSSTWSWPTPTRWTTTTACSTSASVCGFASWAEAVQWRQHGRYGYSPLVDRPVYAWPGGAGWRCTSPSTWRPFLLVKA